MNVAAILASHNRCSQTLRCLESYYAQDVDAEVELTATLVDGGSTDCTVQAVRERFAATRVIERGADLFWAGAMAIAERAAVADDPDYVLWLNDDVRLDRSALRRLLGVATGAGNTAIAIGALRDPSTAEVTYSGVQRTGFHPLRMELITPRDVPMSVETFNGNVVLVPRAVRRKVGAMDGALVHSAADYDYGLRAIEVGVTNLLVPGTIGICDRDGVEQPWRDGSISIRERVTLLFGPKGLPPRPRVRYLRRHGGRAWPLFWAWSYVRAMPQIFWPGVDEEAEERRPDNWRD